MCAEPISKLLIQKVIIFLLQYQKDGMFASDYANYFNPCLFHFLLFLQDCVFTKNFSDTALHVAWTGNLRVYGCTTCCKRWYFTFNGAECSAPLPIDGIVYMWQFRQYTRSSSASAILRGTVTTFTKERCAWDSGLVIAVT